MMDIIEILREDYAKFPIDQSYQIYAEDVYFQDPLTKFRRLKRYQKTIEFIRTWFKDPQSKNVGWALPTDHLEPKQKEFELFVFDRLQYATRSSNLYIDHNDSKYSYY